MNVADTLESVARQYADKPAIVVPVRPPNTPTCVVPHQTGWAISFRDLWTEIETLSRGLRAIGIETGTRTILFVPPSIEFFSLTFALFRIGAVPVLIDPGIGAKQMSHALTSVDAGAFIGVPKAHLFRLLFRSSFPGVRAIVTVGRRWAWGGYTLDDLRRRGVDARSRQAAHHARPADAAAILFTSGSTGPSKGVLYTHGVFTAQVDYLKSYYGYGPDEIDLPTFPLFALFDAALGMTAVIPQMDFTRPGGVDPTEIISRVNRFKCTHMFGSPALLKRVASYGVRHRATMPSLKRVITAGAPVSPAILADFASMLPESARIYTPYGATEALPVASISHDEILAETAARTRAGAGVCVGRPLPGIEVRILPISDEPRPIFDPAVDALPGGGARVDAPFGSIGEIAVRGSIVTREYFGRPDQTAAAGMCTPDGVFWRRMGDVGWIDERGRIWFCGRKSQRVVTRNGTLFSTPVEAVFETHPAVARAALVGIGERGAQIPVVCIERAADGEKPSDESLFAELRKIAQNSGHAREIETFLVHPRFPVDVRHNAKIFREKLANFAATRLRCR